MKISIITVTCNNKATIAATIESVVSQSYQNIEYIIIDGEKVFTHTPWRCDCATYREMNPVSGNFWNGQSSSDLSRSGWCPGTATQPVYFDLSFLKPGKHTITIAIPQGDDEGNSFNHWMVSGMLLGTQE